MLVSSGPDVEAVRFFHVDSLESYVAGAGLKRIRVSREDAVEETFFLGLRLNRGVDLEEVDDRFGREAVRPFMTPIAEMLGQGLIARQGNSIWLTPRGRLLSNEVFERFILTAERTA
jgi:oxygen-independent coproporphyrinogen-3 oxidase